jgi:predicted pyridoxine 5'-phosphate oxidase superfamily flavin-nucleotide-binding protein
MPGEMYGDGARALQDELDTRRLADALAARTIHHELTDDDVALIQAQSTVWISTVDADGWPDVSYKGGDVGFVVVASRTELRIPMFDGNGMNRTMGNVVDTGRVALLFIDTGRPWRMRLHGSARVSTDAADIVDHPGAQAVMIVALERIFPNCGRYIHTGEQISEYVPDETGEAPVPHWKFYDELYDALPERDQRRIDALGEGNG